MTATHHKAKRRPPLRKPDMSMITGWQYDRRRAIAALDHLEAKARRDGDDTTAMAMWSAAYDLRTLLADRAASLIEESVAMYYAHADTWQGNVAHHRRAVRGEVTA